MIHVTVWNEFVHEQEEEIVRRAYPQGIHMALKQMLECEDVQVRTATLQEPECGLTEEVLADTDVLVWWGHMRHELVPCEPMRHVPVRHDLAPLDHRNCFGAVCPHGKNTILQKTS